MNLLLTNCPTGSFTLLRYPFGSVMRSSYPDFPEQSKMTLSVDIKYKSNGQIASLKSMSLRLFPRSLHIVTRLRHPLSSFYFHAAMLSSDLSPRCLCMNERRTDLDFCPFSS